MPEKHPTWTRARVGRGRVRWVAYDDRAEAEGRRVVDQGYAASLVEADAAARSALADAGMHQARRQPTGFGPPGRGARAGGGRPALRREYLYTRHDGDRDDGPFVAAHLVLRKTAARVYVTRRSCGPDQVGTEDEAWEPEERGIPLDRARLERDGSARSASLRGSDFYSTREAATGGPSGREADALGVLGLGAPCTVADIKSAYRRRAFEAHPDRGGSPGDFQAVEAAYRHLLREALGPEP